MRQRWLIVPVVLFYAMTAPAYLLWSSLRGPASVRSAWSNVRESWRNEFSDKEDWRL